MRMKRRDFVKALATLPLAAKSLFPSRLADAQKTQTTQTTKPSEANPATNLPTNSALNFDYRTQMSAATIPDTVAVTEAKFFTHSQMATLRKFADTLMPAADGYPSASQAGVPEFLDFLIGASPAARKKLYRDGLDRLESDSYKQFKIPFTQATAAQADQLLKPWVRSWITDHPPAEPYARFINLAHTDIRNATMNSQAWSIAATAAGERAPGVGLYWQPIDPAAKLSI